MLLSFVLLAQAAAQTSADATQRLRYERAVQMPMLPVGESTVCAVLDAAAFAHAASRSGDDLRLYRDASGASVETPFTLLESEAAPEDAEAAVAQNVAVHGRTLSFDLVMPHRAYSMVRLQLAERDFLAEAVVSAGRPAMQLGSFTVFDLSGEQLARSTELALQETRLPRLHVELRLWRLDGTPVEHPQAGIVRGAEVPPSREAQTLYTTVATAVVPAKGGDANGYSVATLPLAAHLPVERVRFVLDPASTGSFLRSVRIDASPNQGGGGVMESVQGSISRVDRPMTGMDAPAVHYASLAIDDALGSNLRGAATVRVSIEGVDGQPLPVRSVELQMRQRSFCFQAVAGAAYVLRYGDASLPADVYDNMRRSEDGGGKEADDGREIVVTSADARPLVAVLGPEQQNPAFVAQTPRPASGKAHPEMFWVGLLSIVTVAGGIAAHRVRYERDGA